MLSLTVGRAPAANVTRAGGRKTQGEAAGKNPIMGFYRHSPPSQPIGSHTAACKAPKHRGHRLPTPSSTGPHSPVPGLAPPHCLGWTDTREVPSRGVKSSLGTVCGTGTPAWGHGHPTPPARRSNAAKPAPQGARTQVTGDTAIPGGHATAPGAPTQPPLPLRVPAHSSRGAPGLVTHFPSHGRCPPGSQQLSWELPARNPPVRPRERGGCGGVAPSPAE